MPAGLPGTIQSGNPYTLLETDKKMVKKDKNLKSREVLLSAVKEKLHTMALTTTSQDLAYKDPRMQFLLKRVEMARNPLQSTLDYPKNDEIFFMDSTQIDKSSKSFEIEMLNNELATLEHKVNQLKERMDELKVQELSRVFKEFIQYDYEKRYRVTIETMTSALVGEEMTLLDLSKMFNKNKDYLSKKIFH